MSEHWAEIARIDGSIVTISPFRVDVPASSQGIGFGAQFPRVEADNEVELGKILRPAGLIAGKDFGGGRVFQVLMIHDHVDWSTGTFKEVSPDMESLKDCE